MGFKVVLLLVLIVFSLGCYKIDDDDPVPPSTFETKTTNSKPTTSTCSDSETISDSIYSKITVLGIDCTRDGEGNVRITGTVMTKGSINLKNLNVKWVLKHGDFDNEVDVASGTYTIASVPEDDETDFEILVPKPKKWTTCQVDFEESKK